MILHPHQRLKQYRFDGTRWHHIWAQGAKRKGQCRVIYCKRLARVQVKIRPKYHVVHFTVCNTCACRLFRANNPAREIYRQVKDRALRRGQIFAITFEQFCAIPRFDEYVAHRGRGLNELHLDRIKVHLGYVPGNIQVITTAENLRKQHEVDYCPGPF